MNKQEGAPPCPCGSDRALAACCGRYHAGEAAPTAQALMRSRYTAYVLGLEDYLLATWHESSRPASLALQVEAQKAKWLGLKVLGSTEMGEQATVEFVARYKIGGGSAVRMHEISRFVRESGRWFYIDGKVDSD